jgi:multiple sugar transport system substrate-binding protein
MRHLILVATALLLTACEARAPGGALELWAHAGQAAERQVLEQQVQAFNAGQQARRIRITFIPEQTYHAQVQAAAAAGQLPDILELDGPYLATYAWQGHLRPLDDLLPRALRDDLLPSILVQGSYADRLWAIASFDSGLGLYARRSHLIKAGLRIPTGPAQAWTVDEFDNALAELARVRGTESILDLKLNYRGEWYTYAFAPILHSAGAGLIERAAARAEGVLDATAAVGAMTRLQRWITLRYVDPNLDDAAFTDGRVSLSWSGHWSYPAYRAALGDDLIVLPLPDFGEGSRTGQGSWAWGITAGCPDPRTAMRFLSFLLEPEQVLAMTAVNGAVPGTRSALARSDLYGSDGPLRLFAVQLLEGYSVPRPRTPAYPVITSAFQEAFQRIRDGGEVGHALKVAAAIIDREIRDNRGYPQVAIER